MKGCSHKRLRQLLLRFRQMAHKLIKAVLPAALIGAEYAYNYFRSSRSVPPLNPSSSRLSSRPSSNMVYPKYRRTNKSRRRPMMRPKWRPPARVGPARGLTIVPFRRTSAPIVVSTASGVGGFRSNVTLSQVFLTDILPVFDVYRMKRVTIEVIPRWDTGANYVSTSGGAIGPNDTIWAVAACDPANESIAAPTLDVVSKFGNYKCQPIVSGGNFKYSFYPKVSNSVQGASASVNSGSYGKFNPWLKMDADGVLVPHSNIIFGLQTAFAASLVTSYTYTLTIEFDCLISN